MIGEQPNNIAVNFAVTDPLANAMHPDGSFAGVAWSGFKLNFPPSQVICARSLLIMKPENQKKGENR